MLIKLLGILLPLLALSACAASKPKVTVVDEPPIVIPADREAVIAAAEAMRPVR